MNATSVLATVPSKISVLVMVPSVMSDEVTVERVAREPRPRDDLPVAATSHVAHQSHFVSVSETVLTSHMTEEPSVLHHFPLVRVVT